MKPPVLIGYFPKRRTPRPEWLSGSGVAEICSVSGCIAEGPRDWIAAWRHNEWGFYDTPELAMSVVREEERGEFDLYAYGMDDVKFVRGEAVPVEIRATETAPLDPTFEKLGYDIVSKGTSDFFECSPFSCNRWAGEVGANRFCLVDGLTRARDLAARAEASGCEPGDYYVLEVWRRGRDGGPVPG